MEHKEIFNKYNLPSFEDLDNHFEIQGIEEYYLRSIRKKMSEKFEAVATHIQDILNPDNSTSSMVESGFFDDSQKEAFSTIFKQLLFQIRKSTCLNIDDSDELNVQYINEAYSFWMENKSEIKTIFETIRDSWKQDLNKSEKIRYLG